MRFHSRLVAFVATLALEATPAASQSAIDIRTQSTKDVFLTLCPAEASCLAGRISTEWLIPLAPADQDVVGGGLEGETEAEQTLEGGGGRPAAIEAEDELVEIRLQVLRPQAVIDPERPPLRVREH